MAQLADILQQERERDTEDKWGLIHLYKTGSFYSAYEWSAWLIAVITFNDEVRMATKDRKPIAVTRIPMANSDETFCRVGFPLKSIEKYIPIRLNYEAEDDKHLVITVALPQPQDGSEVTYERLAEAVAKWKAEQPLKQPKDKKDSDPQADTDRQPAQGKPKRTLLSLIQEAQQQQAPSQGGLIMQIMSYQLSQHTPADNYEFIYMITSYSLHKPISKQRCTVGVEIQRCVFMRAQNARGTGGCDLAVKGSIDSLRLGRGGNDAIKLLTAHKSGNGKSEGVGGNVRDRCKATVVYLLISAHLVELDALDELLILEVREGRIVEGYVSVLANAENHDINGVFS